METTTIYWSGDTGWQENFDWNILFNSPDNLYHDLSKNINKESITSNFFMCPSFKSLTKKAFVIKNPIKSTFILQEDNNVVSDSPIIGEELRQPSIIDNRLFRYGISYFFFSEEDVEATITPPYLHNSGHQKYGALVPGSFNIGSWFRQINFEYNLWSGVDSIKFDEEEAIAYISFNTNKKIILKRFAMSEKLYKIQNTCGQSSKWEPMVSLSKRYNRFKKSNMKKIVIQEIKRNLI